MLLAFQGLCTKGASLCPRASKCHHVLSRDLRCFATMPMEKITFGKDNLPGYVVGDVSNPGVIVIQVGFRFDIPFCVVVGKGEQSIMEKTKLLVLILFTSSSFHFCKKRKTKYGD